jgi:hypothetical protein
LTARAVINPKTPQRPLSTLPAKIVDNSLPSKESGDLSRVVIGGVSAPIGVDDATKESLEQAAQKRREKAELRKKRNQPVKNPVSFVVKEARKERRVRELQDAYDAVLAYAQRPKCKVREYDAWTSEQREEFKQRLLTFVRSTPEPTPRQKLLVDADLKRQAREWSFGREEVRDKPWQAGSDYARWRIEGYHGSADDMAGGKYLIGHDYTECYLRSTLDPVLWRFVIASPKAGKSRLMNGTIMQRLMAGPTKSDRAIEWTKLHALEQEYIQLHTTMRQGWRHELDRTFRSWRHLRRKLVKLVRRRRLACLPHVVVGHEDPETGELVHPHLWWFLPVNNEVLYDRDNPKAKQSVMDLYDGVVVGSFLALQHLGADAGGLANVVDGKNPLSPKWSCQVWNDSEFPTLKDWKSCVDIYHKRRDVVREQAIAASDQPVEVSCAAFTAAKEESDDILRTAHFGRDPHYLDLLDDRRALCDWLFDRLDQRLRAEFPRNRGTLRLVARHKADEWDPSKLGADRNRGAGYAYVRHIALRDEAGKPIDGAAEARQGIGGKVGRKLAQLKSIDAVLTGLELLHERSQPLTLENVLPVVTGIVRRTIVRNFPAAMAAYYVGKMPSLDLKCMLGSVSENRNRQEPSFAAPEGGYQPREPAQEAILTCRPGSYEYASEPATTETSLAPCSPPSESPAHEHQSEYVSPCCACPPPLGGAPSAPSSVIPTGDGESVQRDVSRASAEIRNSDPEGTGRGGSPSSGPSDHVRSEKCHSYATAGRRDSSICDLGEQQAGVLGRGHQGKDSGNCEQSASGGSLTHAGAQLILFVPNPCEGRADRKADEHELPDHKAVSVRRA